MTRFLNLLNHSLLPLLLLLLVAGVLRLCLLSNGLPLIFHEDEPIYLNRALQFGFGDFNPDYFKKPSFFLYFYFLFYYLYYCLSDFTNWQAFVSAFQTDPTTTVLIGRGLTFLFSIITVGWLYKLGSRAFSKSVGLGAAFLLALDHTHLKTSSTILADIPALCMIMGCAWFALSVYEKGRWRDYLLCALFTALAISFKYNFFTAMFLLSAHGFRTWAETGDYRNLRSLGRTFFASKKLWIALATIPTIFFALSPYTLLNFGKFFEDMDHERRHMTMRSLEVTNRQFSPMIGFDNIFFQILPKAMGWPLYILGLLGIISLFLPFRFEKRPQALILLSFPLVFILVLCQFRLVNAKYLIPVIPFWYLCGALFLARVVTLRPVIPEQLRRLQLKYPIQQAPVYAAGLLLLAWPLLDNSLQYVLVNRQTDTRTLARHYLEEQVPLGASVMTEPETVPLHTNTPVLGQMMLLQHTQHLGHPVFQVTAQSPSDLLVKAPVRPSYVLMMLKPLKDKNGNKFLPYPSEYYQMLQAHYHIKKVFSPFPVNDTETELSNKTDYMDVYNTLKPKKAKAKRPGPLMLLLEAR